MRHHHGYTTWTGGLVAKALGDVSADQVWRVLRKHGIQLQRRRSWCVSTDPQFAQAKEGNAFRCLPFWCAELQDQLLPRREVGRQSCPSVLALFR